MPLYRIGFVCVQTGHPVSERKIRQELRKARGGDEFDGKTLDEAFEDLVRDGIVLWGSGKFDYEALALYSDRNRAIFSYLLNGRYRFWFTPNENKLIAVS